LPHKLFYSTIYAGGVIIAPDALTNYTPDGLRRAMTKGRKEKELIQS